MQGIVPGTKSLLMLSQTKSLIPHILSALSDNTLNNMCLPLVLAESWRCPQLQTAGAVFLPTPSLMQRRCLPCPVMPFWDAFYKTSTPSTWHPISRALNLFTFAIKSGLNIPYITNQNGHLIAS